MVYVKNVKNVKKLKSCQEKNKKPVCPYCNTGLKKVEVESAKGED